MRVLLPPSETKRDGGDGHPVDLSSLLCADRLTDTRQRIVTAVGHLAKNAATCMATLRLGPISAELQAAADVAARARDAAAYRWVNVASLFAF